MNVAGPEEKKIKKTLDKIKSLENLITEPCYNIDQPQDYKLEIKIDNKVENGKFIPSKAITGIWYASEQTFMAMKKNIFATGENIDELIDLYQCSSCHKELDKQFWNFCPFCGAKFLE